MTERILAFTGHRPGKLGGYGDSPMQRWIRHRITYLIQEIKPVKCIVGMALGVDQWAAEVCITMAVPFDAYVPFVGLELVWPPSAQQKYRSILEKANEIKYISLPPYSASKMQVRNEAMVKACTDIGAVYDGSSGGTKNCLDFARAVGRQVHLIDPNDLPTTDAA